MCMLFLLKKPKFLDGAVISGVLKARVAQIHMHRYIVDFIMGMVGVVF